MYIIFSRNLSLSNLTSAPINRSRILLDQPKRWEVLCFLTHPCVHGMAISAKQQAVATRGWGCWFTQPTLRTDVRKKEEANVKDDERRITFSTIKTSSSFVSECVIFSNLNLKCEMKLYSLLVLHKPESGDPTVLKAAFDLTSFGYFQRSSIQEFIRFTSKGRIDPAETASMRTLTSWLCFVS